MNDKIGLIVDGHGDFASIKKRFKNNFKVLKTDGPRGHTAKIKDIVAKSRKQISILKAYKCKSAIIIIDFEERTYEHDQFFCEITKAFETANFSIPVNIAIPNRMIENWYLADIEYLSQKTIFLKDKLKQQRFEGKHGKNELKKCFKHK
jgi:hypothetical protein